jgi:cysteine desulfurase family protein (TIGR01976 family)
VAGVEEIRSHFPATERQHAGFPVAYFDGPGGTQVPREVTATVEEYLFQHNANRHWAFPTSAETDRVIDGAREAIADFLGATPGEIAFGANMTTLAFHIGRALGRRWGSGDEIVVTELDHLANVAPWQAIADERGVTIRTAPMLPESCTLDWAALEQLVTGQTRLLAIGAASNAVGTISDLDRAAKLARKAGALLFVDAVHFAPHELVNVSHIDCDFLACSAYKFYGPHIGALYARREVASELDVARVECAPNTVPERLETGTLNHEGIAGAAAAVDFLASLGTGDSRRERLESTFLALHERGKELVRVLWEGLNTASGVQTYGPPPGSPRTPTVGFTVEGLPSKEVARRLAEEWGVFVSHGHFYAANVTERLGLTDVGLVRAGCACYTTREEVERLVEGVERIASG